MEGLLHGVRQLAHILDQEVVLDDGAGDADGVALLECIGADVGRRGLAADHDQGNGIGVGGGNAGDGVGQAGTRGHQGHADFTRGTGKTVCRMHSRLLVAHQHMLNGVLLVEGVVDVQDRTARIAPKLLDAFGLQGLDEDPEPISSWMHGTATPLLPRWSTRLWKFP